MGSLKKVKAPEIFKRHTVRRNVTHLVSFEVVNGLGRVDVSFIMQYAR